MAIMDVYINVSYVTVYVPIFLSNDTYLVAIFANFENKRLTSLNIYLTNYIDKFEQINHFFFFFWLSLIQVHRYRKNLVRYLIKSYLTFILNCMKLKVNL